jgi:glyoxylase-like metal-dependent hydrolase (beta-lactamase superfamily II)
MRDNQEEYMDKVDVSDVAILPMDAIAPGITGLRIAFVNVFAAAHRDGSWTLIDSGIPHMASHIQSWAEKHFPAAPNAIVLTHGHFDHAGSVQALAETWDVPIYAHPLEFPYLTGKLEYPAPNWKAGGGMMSLLSPTLPRGPIDVGNRLRALPGEGSELSLLELPGWRLLHTPGHTPGHVSFYREADSTLLVGDAFCTTKPESFFEAALAQNAELHGPPAYFTSDWEAAKRSVRKLAGLQPHTVIPGHGKPLSGPDVPTSLQKLAEDFERIARPENGTGVAVN